MNFPNNPKFCITWLKILSYLHNGQKRFNYLTMDLNRNTISCLIMYFKCIKLGNKKDSCPLFCWELLKIQKEIPYYFLLEENISDLRKKETSIFFKRLIQRSQTLQVAIMFKISPLSISLTWIFNLVNLTQSIWS